MAPLFGFQIFGLGLPELLVIAGLGVLLFGRRLPEIGRYLGKGIVEFKKGVKGLEDEVEGSYRQGDAALPPSSPAAPPRMNTAPRFEDAPNPPPPPKV
jgi:sec-independent protein translocase protein TatA